jgi:predicted Zn-dependent peptidase
MTQDIKYNKTVLSNGLKVISEQTPFSKSFALGVCVNVGSRDDFKEAEGIAHFVEHAVFRRTKNKTSKKISEEFESLGAYTNAFTTKEVICFYARALTPNFKKIIDLIYDITIEPVFVDKDVDKERSIIIEEIKSYLDDPEELIMDFADESLFKGHELAHPIIGYESSVEKIDADLIKKFHDKFFVSENIVLAFTGNIEHEELVKYAEKKFGKIPRKGVQKENVLPALSIKERVTIDKDYSQNHILYCRQVTGFSSTERYALTALNFILGEGMSSRINIALRERYGMVYTAYSNLHFFSDSGAFSIYAGSERNNIKRIEQVIEAETKKLKEFKISDKELNRAKEQLKANTVMALESMSSRMQNLAKSEFLLNRFQHNEELMNLIDSVNQDQINDIIDKYLTIQDWSEIVFKIN